MSKIKFPCQSLGMLDLYFQCAMNDGRGVAIQHSNGFYMLVVMSDFDDTLTGKFRSQVLIEENDMQESAKTCLRYHIQVDGDHAPFLKKYFDKSNIKDYTYDTTC